ncbi:hypothetical protein [Methylobacterium gregans]|uniref:Uncharacterized protein n=1 Tax=Methylobacterium gregans TaxID=374424 RepID=A0AA37HPJ2_9HYPH|nr:hypothetical protein [Methylobacterium gregans]MDQ0523791.1 hypothetical protein [Methylobacterium gregans]GJD79390.1 hypothetical protein NBEOAGPD_2616 [Methylobacterium gregans]
MYVDNLATDFADLGESLRLLSREISGRKALLAEDIAETEIRIARAHTALDRISERLIYSRPGLLTPGANYKFHEAHIVEAERAAAAAAAATEAQS